MNINFHWNIKFSLRKLEFSAEIFMKYEILVDEVVYSSVSIVKTK